MTVTAFWDPLSQRVVELHIGADRASTGIEHDGCEALADVSPELDCAFCPRCHWQCRISGAWFMDVLAESDRQPESGPTGGGGEPTAASGSTASIVARAPSSTRGPDTSEEE